MSKKIGVLNFHYSNNNYGAVLQAAALADVIGRLGYSVEHIDFIPQEIKKKKTLRQLLVSILAVLGIKLFLKRMLGKKEYIKPVVIGNEVFEQFRDAWIVRSPQTYTTVQQLNSIDTTYRTVIVGSDQVWRPNMLINKNQDIDAYYLSFLPDSVNRVSYAASFGVDNWEETEDTALTDRVCKAINKFNAISVRETSGVSICRDNFGVKAQHVLDPTLLNGVDFFERIIADAGVSKQSENVVYYKLDIDASFISAIADIGKVMQASTEDIYYQRKNDTYHYISVANWLAKIRDSKFVVTDSFHCVCIAILFNKNFICFSNRSRGLARLRSLLNILGIEGRLLGDISHLPKSFSQFVDIDYSHVNSRLMQLRMDSECFLRESLSDVQ